MAAEQMEKLARGVRPRFERARKVGNPAVVRDEFFFARVGVVHAIDPILRQRGIVGVRRPDVVVLASRFVQIVIEVCAGGHETVDVAVEDEVGDHHPQPAGGERARHPEEDRHIVLQHLLPDAVRRRKVAPLKRDPLHSPENLLRGEPRLDGERLDRRLQETGFLFHARTIKA